MMPDPDCHCAPVREKLEELALEVERWARVEQPKPEHIDMLGRDATRRIRAAALVASVGTKDAS
jgi:hypothetical protein